MIFGADNYTKRVTDFEKDTEKEFKLSVLQLNVTKQSPRKHNPSNN